MATQTTRLKRKCDRKLLGSSHIIQSSHCPQPASASHQPTMDSLITKRESHPYMQLHEKVLIPLTPPPAQHKGHNSNNNNSSLRNLFGILMGLCLFIVYVYWSSSAATSSPVTVAGEFNYLLWFGLCSRLELINYYFMRSEGLLSAIT